MNNLDFTFSDTVAGYVTSANREAGSFQLKTSDDREFEVIITDTTYAEVIRNLGEPWQDPGAPIMDVLEPGRYLYAYGIFYPEDDKISFEAKHLVLVGVHGTEWRFESPEWWVVQIRSLAEFYYRAQFPDGNIDFANYRTHLTLEGQKIESTRQETDTISRMIYGFASAYMLTGEDKYLEVAEKGTEYLREHMRSINEEEQVAYWYHAIDVKGGRERKILASEFGDDFNAIAAYEEIYALAGPVQTYRITGDPEILRDAEWTVNLFERYFKDNNAGGYFSHVDPVTMDPKAESLTHNRARKNWNSVGDHAPAYLINLYLATEDKRYGDMLVECADTIAKHFPDYGESPYVNEKFNEDWSHDRGTPLQKNRAIVGHNLKIAWNLMRVYNMNAKGEYQELSEKIADLMPQWGMDKQRGGWYDMVERHRKDPMKFHRLIWHDRKAWWQQEQGILAYLIMAGSIPEPDSHQRYVKYARESAAFYNAWFPDHDSGGVYFNVLANGIPFLLGTERLKGSHSMSGYHSFELCYLASIYQNLLITKQPMDFYFKPQRGSLKDNILRVAPDLLPPGSIQIEAVWINGRHWSQFDAEALTVTLPTGHEVEGSHPLEMRPQWAGNPTMLPSGSSDELRVKVRMVPAGMLWDIDLTMDNGEAQLILAGTFTDKDAMALSHQLDRVIAAKPRQLIIYADDLESLSCMCARALAFATQKLELDEDIFLIAASEAVKHTLKDTGFLEEVTVLDEEPEEPLVKP